MNTFTWLALEGSAATSTSDDLKFWFWCIHGSFNVEFVIIQFPPIHVKRRIGDLSEGVRQRRVMSNFKLGQCRSYDLVLKSAIVDLGRKWNWMISSRIGFTTFLRCFSQSVSDISRSRRVVFTAIYLDVLLCCMILSPISATTSFWTNLVVVPIVTWNCLWSCCVEWYIII